VKAFIARGGVIAWGVVPSSEAIDRETIDSLAKRIEAALELMASKGIDRKSIQSIVTPSCGLGSLDEARAEKIIASTAGLSLKMSGR